MELEAVERILDQLFPQLSALEVALWEIKVGTPLLMVEEIDVAVDQICAKARKVLVSDGI